MARRSLRMWASVASVAVLVGALIALRYSGFWVAAKQVVGLAVMGSTRDLRSRAASTPVRSPDHPELLILALDGVDRALLYQLLRAGELPNLAQLLGVDEAGDFPNAFFDETRLSTLPSITMAAWATVFTGATPAHHGIPGNEFFIRETREFAAPASVTVAAPELSVKVYTENYLGKHLRADTVYQQMRARDPHVLIWVAMSQIYQGADTLIVTSRVALLDAFTSLFAEAAESAVDDEEDKSELYATIDREVIEEVVELLKDNTPPDVLTIYLPGTDLYAHVAEEGPDDARSRFLKDKVDPELGKLTAVLQDKGALDNRYVVVTSDHGHSKVEYDDHHALYTDEENDPPALLRAIGRRLRPFEIEVDAQHDFDVVLAYQGAMAFVYLADRSTCSAPEQACDWRSPPRMEEDVMPVAAAFYRNNLDGSIVPAMKGSLDLVLTRVPRAFADTDLPFQVYTEGGKLISISEYLETTPRPDLLALAARLRELAVGPLGERAGDVLLLAAYGSAEDLQSRFYFSGKYESWHGSANRQDSEIPFIVAHPSQSGRQLQAQVERATEGRPWQWLITEILLGLRYQ